MVVDFLPSKRYLSITLFHNNMKDNKHLTILLSEWYDFSLSFYHSASGKGEYLPKGGWIRGVFSGFHLKFSVNWLNQYESYLH